MKAKKTEKRSDAEIIAGFEKEIRRAKAMKANGEFWAHVHVAIEDAEEVLELLNRKYDLGI